MITSRQLLAGDGASNTAALAFGGCIIGGVTCTESYASGKFLTKKI
jgi:hypothetical protein